MDKLLLHILCISFLTYIVHGALNCSEIEGLTVNDTSSVGDVIHDFGVSFQLKGDCSDLSVNGTQLLLNKQLRNPCTYDTSVGGCWIDDCSQNLVVSINRIDAYPPSFPSEAYIINISETLSSGAVAFVFDASDESRAIDPDCQAKIEYQLDQSDGGNFTISSSDRDSGAVTINGTVLYDERVNYTLVVRASSTGQYTTTILYVTVNDEDNKGPAFTENTYHLNITEEVIQTIPPLLQCFDQDTGINTTVLYSFNEMSLTSPYFEISSTTGQLEQIRSIDRETQTSFILNVNCYQDNDHGKITSGFVEVTVLDINDNLPVFDSLNTSVTVTEHISGYITNVHVTDKDEGDNAVIQYSLVEGDDAFEIDSDTGVISVKSSELLDRDKTETLNIQVRAGDLMGNFSEHNATITVYLQDVNDNSPQFDLDHYIFTFNISDIDAVIGTVVANDSDVIDTPNSNVTYDVVDTWTIGSNEPFPLTLDHYTGDISINAWVQNNLEYNMLIKACDNPAVESDRRCSHARVTAEYTFNMTDNVFVTQINMSISENLPVGSVVGQLPLSGMRYDSFNLSSAAFTIDSQRMLVTTSILDREDRDVYDDITILLYSSTMIVGNISIYLTVLDANDNSPVFSDAEYFFSLPHQGGVSNVVLGTIMAIDNDTNKNSDLSYSLYQNQLQDMFILDHESGQLSLSPAWWESSHRQSMYTLTVTVADNGSPSLKGTALVHISNMERVDNVSVMLYTEATDAYINENINILQKDMATILGYVSVNIDGIEVVTSEQTHIRTKFHMSASDTNNTYVPFEELQRSVLRRWYPLYALFQTTQIWAPYQSSTGISATEIALIAMGGIILLGGLILVPVVCRQWNKHVREHQLYDHLRRPSTIYDSQELRLDFPEETPRSQFSSFRAPYRFKEDGNELEGSFGMAYVSPVFVDDDGNPPKTPTWSLNEQPRIPLWSTSDSLKDVMASLEDLSDRLNAEDNISGVTELSRNRSLKSFKSRNSETSGARDNDIVDWHADATLTDGTITTMVQNPKDNTIYANVPTLNLSETTENVGTSLNGHVGDSEINEIILKPTNSDIEQLTAF